MIKKIFPILSVLLAVVPANSIAAVECKTAGPQTPRDISISEGKNDVQFDLAPEYKELNLCNIHTHTNAEHKGPDFSILVGQDKNGGYACNETYSLSTEQLIDPLDGKGAFKGVKPGDTIEVHWVHTSCNITPGEGLGSCVSKDCKNPKLRVETQVFLLVNDDYALDFNDYTYEGNIVNNLHQAKKIPTDTGKPVVFNGSTTGPKYNQTDSCSEFQVTWSVRPLCAKLDIKTLHKWAEKGNAFNENESHGVRQLVTKPELLSNF